jgi:hypothetical protein
MGEHLSGIGENDCVVLFALRRRLAAINAILDTIVRSGADTALRNGRRWPPPDRRFQVVDFSLALHASSKVARCDAGIGDTMREIPTNRTILTIRPKKPGAGAPPTLMGGGVAEMNV